MSRTVTIVPFPLLLALALPPAQGATVLEQLFV
jgi:hypothetical protein